MLQDWELIIKAEEVLPENWEEIQNLVDQASDERTVKVLEKIMIDKFNEYSSL
ncbi:hypothetical protein [Tenacibaculum sp.]|uniref:hypothetical protein n=1 Tax=Tenacibaculum sp. TaxID=1906242 RepID=UPI003D0E4B18